MQLEKATEQQLRAMTLHQTMVCRGEHNHTTGSELVWIITRVVAGWIYEIPGKQNPVFVPDRTEWMFQAREKMDGT